MAAGRRSAAAAAKDRAPPATPAKKGKALPATPAKKGRAPPPTPAKKGKAPPATPAKKAAKPKAIEEPLTESEEESETENTIYEEMSDDSAIEGCASEQEDSASEQEEEEQEQDDEDNEEEEEEEEDDDDDDAIDEEALLAGIKGSDSEVSESEGEEEDKDEFSKGGAKISLDDNDKASAEILARVRQLKTTKSTKPGVVYIGRIPHGFYEEQMLGYLKQFGAIKRLRLSRNPTTGRSRHYAFVEFAHAEVAKIVAETMDNYLMFDKLLKCKVVPADKVHPRLFADRKKAPARDRGLRLHKAAHDRQRTPAEVGKQVDRLVKAERKRRAKLAAAGIDYEYPGYEGLRPPKAKHTKFN
ncbi:hypothetical protein H4R18_005189 [Coemansia javaensis]|uniref:RRM domain-containing protein n=1 Tax=Coemansia javaensis TaxID=2761396 RepID=A0A9W8H3X7_9FUNG|nr:hypothetical protein H4R18_005189 [Coemansia javaensis]